MSALEILAVIGIIGFVIYQQLAGQLLRGKRVVVLPAVVTVIGFYDLRGHHLGPADIAWLTVGAVGSVLIGLAFGLIMRLESRDGVLWGKMPLRGGVGRADQGQDADHREPGEPDQPEDPDHHGISIAPAHDGRARRSRRSAPAHR